MIEIDVTVDIEPIEIDVAVDLVPPSGGGVTVHNQLTGRDAAEAHPGSSISLEAVEWADVQAMADDLDDNEAIAFDGVTIIGTGDSADPYKVADDTFIVAPDTALATEPDDTDYIAIFTTSWLRLTWLSIKTWLTTYFDTIYGRLLIQFFDTEQINAFTITADMLYKMVKINSATAVNVTVANMVVGSGVRFHILGAGLPVFLEGASQSITGVDEDGKPLGTDRTDVLIERFENDGTTEIYNVI